MTAPTPLLVPGVTPSTPAAAQMHSQDDVVKKIGLSETLSTTLSLYAVFIGGLFFAPVMPNIFYLLFYVVIVELITYVLYKVAKWDWNYTSRLAIGTASILGYLVGIGTYKLVQAYIMDPTRTF